MIDAAERYRLRPSVSIIPTEDDLVIELFQSNTRRLIHVRLASKEFSSLLLTLDGAMGLGEAIARVSTEPTFRENALKLIRFLFERCFVELVPVSNRIEENAFYRVINMLSDYIPSDEVLEAFSRIRNSTVLLIGAGAIGSWVSTQLAHSGVRNIVLCDTDIVSVNNLNRSLYVQRQVGQLKARALAETLQAMNTEAHVTVISEHIDSGEKFENVLRVIPSPDLVINCADYPNVDVTSTWICKALMPLRVSHIIAGGYNLHLSLLGPTIIPGKSACFECIRLGLEESAPPEFEAVRKLERSKRNIGNLAPLAGVAASFTAHEALRCLVKDERLMPQMLNKRGEYNFLTQELHCSDFPRRSDCSWCRSL